MKKRYKDNHKHSNTGTHLDQKKKKNVNKWLRWTWTCEMWVR